MICKFLRIIKAALMNIQDSLVNHATLAISSFILEIQNKKHLIIDSKAKVAAWIPSHIRCSLGLTVCATLIKSQIMTIISKNSESIAFSSRAKNDLLLSIRKYKINPQ